MSRDKGKGKATDQSPAPASQPERKKPNFTAGPEPIVIQYFSEPTGAPQRGYRQNKFEEAYKDVATRLAEKEAEERADRIVAQRERSDKAQAYTQQRDYITRNLNVSPEQAETALLKHNGDSHLALLDLTAPVLASQ